MTASAGSATEHKSPIEVPIAATGSGKVRGQIVDGIRIFKGIPYAATTAGVNRFCKPRPTDGWSGVRDALSYP